MSNRKYILLISILLVVSLYLVYMPEINEFFKKLFSGKKVNESQNTAPEPAAIDANKMLKKGSKGIEVTELQKRLKKVPTVNLGNTGSQQNGIDGDFGPLTETALFKVKGVKQITLNQYDKK